MNSFINDIFDKMATEAARLALYNKKVGDLAQGRLDDAGTEARGAAHLSARLFLVFPFHVSSPS